MTNRTKMIIKAIVSYVLAMALILFVFLPTSIESMPDVVVCIWIVVVGFFLGYGIFGFLWDCSSMRKVKGKHASNSDR